MWKITKQYLAGNPEKINEDALVINEEAGIYAVMDGATGLAGMPGHFASYTVKEQLAKMTGEADLYAVLSEANQAIAAKTLAYYREHFTEVTGLTAIEKHNRSTTGMIAAEITMDNNWLNFYHAGDCMLFLQYENDAIRMITYDLIQFLDDQVIEQMSAIRKENGFMTLAAVRKEVTDELIKNRNKLNTNSGYTVLDGSDEALQMLESGRISLRRVKKILLLSDGLTYPVHSPMEESWRKSADIAFTDGLEALKTAVLTKENADPECIVYPRLKKSDDKTAILLERV